MLPSFSILDWNTCFFCDHRKDAKKVQKLESQIPYHEGRGNFEEAQKVREQIEDIWRKAKETAYA